MDTIIKLIIRLVYQIIKPNIYRITEARRTAFIPSFENYPTRLSDISRKEHKGLHYLGIRLKQNSETRFSMLMPGASTRYEQEYFLTRSWVSYFDDTRSSQDNPKQGLLIHWSDEALGKTELYEKCWNVIQKLPTELIELHSTKDYLRAIFEGPAEKIRTINTKVVIQELKDLKNELDSISSNGAHRSTFAFKELVLTFIFNIILLLSFVALIFALLPAVDYLDYQQGDNIIFISAPILALMIFIRQFMSGASIFRSIQTSVFVAFLIIMTLFAAYLRINYVIRADAVTETWQVAKFTEQRARRTKIVTGYNFSLLAAPNKWNKLFVRKDKIKNPEKLVGAYATLNLYTDVLGYQFADSIKVVAKSNSDKEQVIELLE